MELLYLTDISQLDYVVATAPELLKRTRPVTGDFVVSFELEKLGIDFIDEWDFLGPGDIQRNWETAHLLSKGWWDDKRASTVYAGISLSDAAQQDMVYSFQACLNARTVYYRIFALHPVQRISGFFLPPVAVIRTGPAPASRAVNAVAQAVLFYIAQRRGTPVIRLNSGYPLSIQRASYRNVATSNKPTVKLFGVGNAVNNVVLIHEDGIYGSEHGALTEVLGEMKGVKAFSISRRVLEMGVQSKCSKSGAESRLQLFWEAFTESVKNYDGSYPEIFGNTHLLFQFEGIRNEMETAANYGEFYKAFLNLLRPSMIFFGHEAFTIERTLVRLARSKDITTAAFLHGGLGLRLMWRGITGDADTIVVWNGIDIEYLASYGVDESRLTKVGGLRYKSDHVNTVNNLRANSSKSKGIAKKRLGVRPDKPLIALLSSQINTGFAAPIAYPSKHRSALREFLALVGSRPDLQFVIKAHPNFDYYELYRRMLNSKLPNLAFFEQTALNEILEASDICLMMNYCTTAAIEAMLYQVPVIYLENAVYPLRDWSDSLSANGILRVHTIAELEDGIDSLLTNPAAREHALAQAGKEINRILDVSEVPEDSRLFDFLKHAIDDRQTGNAELLINPQVMRKILFSNDTKEVSLGNYLSEADIRRSGEHLMYAFAYLAGINSLGRASIPRIFGLFKSYLGNDAIATWREAQWYLLPAYITGSIDNLVCGGSRFSFVRLLSPYLIYPNRFICAPAFFKRYVMTNLIKMILGRTSLSVLIRMLNWFVTMQVFRLKTSR